jgi:tRNA/rRNA methyltransferase
LWEALATDRRFAGNGFKRQVPVGTHITDFVSFPLRVVIDVLPARESEVAAKTRNDRQAWLIERGYRVLAVDASMIESDLPQVLDGLAASISGRP